MRIMGRPRALLAVLGGALLLAGCGSGPSQLGAAVIIGDRSVSVDHVQELIDKAVREQPYAQQLAKEHKLDQLGREIVRQEVLHEVIGRAAQREKLGFNEAQLAQVLQKDPLAGPATPTPNADAANLSEVVARARDHRDSLTDTLIQQELALKYLPSLTVGFDYVAFSASRDPGDASTPPPAVDEATLRAQAIEKAKLLASGPEAAAADLKQEAATGRGRTGLKQAAIASPSDAATVLFGVPANTVVAFSPQAGLWVAAVIHERTTGAPVAVDQAAKPTADDLIDIGRRLLQPFVGDVSFTVNPRYGVWDAVGMDLAPSESKTKGIVLPMHGSAQPQQ